MWLRLACRKPGTRPVTQACALTGTGTSDPVVRSRGLNPLRHTSQGRKLLVIDSISLIDISLFTFFISSYMNLGRLCLSRSWATLYFIILFIKSSLEDMFVGIREKETSISCLLYALDQGLNRQPRYVS